MVRIKPDQAIRDLTIALMYLTRFSEGEKFSEAKVFYAWKGYDFDVLKEFDDKDLVSLGNNPARTKRAYLTKEGMEYAKAVLDKLGIDDWQAE